MFEIRSYLSGCNVGFHTQAAETFISENFRTFLKSPDFLKLLVDDVKAMLKFKSKQDSIDEDKYRFVIEWTKYNIDYRRKHFSDLFHLIQLNSLSKKFLNEVVRDEELVKQSADCMALLVTALINRIPESINMEHQREPDEVLVIGRKNHLESVVKFNTKTKQWSGMPSMQNGLRCWDDSDSHCRHFLRTEDQSAIENFLEQRNVSNDMESSTSGDQVKDEGICSASEQEVPNGNKKRVYDRDFLLRFRNDALSKERPESLPEVGEIIMDLSVLWEVQLILNQATSQKLGPLMQKFKKLPIHSEQRLQAVVDLIFQRVLDKPKFAEVYANVCHMMSQILTTTPSPSASDKYQEQTRKMEFRKLLLMRCQRKFEKNRQKEGILNKLRQKLENATSVGTKQKRKSQLEVVEAKIRKEMLGNIKFIGELFKLRMLAESIMHMCIMDLFKSRNNESLECLCALLTTIGEDLDHIKEKQRMDQYFHQLDKVIGERKTSFRVRHLLRDVVNLRKNQWIPRPVQAQGPETIELVNVDVKERFELKAAVTASAAAGDTGGKSQNSEAFFPTKTHTDTLEAKSKSLFTFNPRHSSFTKLLDRRKFYNDICEWIDNSSYYSSYQPETKSLLRL
ncbi:uncharacterized protein LOC143466115 [Clavelina lepadiformis]|uniref:uncharacterized protein LOC143466115 n=1 Tax=Clavelina lepadiformis TaxID=159417 RepID=UPI0040417984